MNSYGYSRPELILQEIVQITVQKKSVTKTLHKKSVQHCINFCVSNTIIILTTSTLVIMIFYEPKQLT